VRWSATKLLPILLMFSLALLTFFLERTVREEERDPSQRRHDADYVITNFTTTTYNSDGVADSIMSAARMIHYPDDDSTELVEPRLEENRPAEARTTVSAERGTLARESDDIFLYDNVVLVREAGKDQPEARMRTSFLHLVRDRSLARTDREVVFEEPNRSLEGRGMEYRYDSGQLVLHAEVRGRFAPGNDR
jgi:lipopolysaccharide export system protein LptC